MPTPNQNKLLDFPVKNKDESLKLFINKADSSAEILLYGAIGDMWWDDSAVSAKMFSDKLKELPADTKTLNIRINSPGGSVFDGVTIYERLRAYATSGTGKKVIVHVDGLAASIASIIAMAGDEVNIGEGGMFMLHKPLVMTIGNAEAHERNIEILDKIESQMVSIYAKKTGMGRTELFTVLANETWYTADEALEAGLVDKKNEAETVKAVASMHGMLASASWIRNKPEMKSKNELARTKLREFNNSAKQFLKK